MTIETNKRLEITNLISFRKQSAPMELQGYMERLLAYIAAQGAEKIGGGMSATYAMEADTIDMEVYIPINKEIPSTNEFTYKPRLYLENCIMAKHKGHPQFLEQTIQGLNDYIVSNNLTPISAGFNVTVNEVHDPKDADLFEVDVYISISPNVI